MFNRFWPWAVLVFAFFESPARGMETGKPSVTHLTLARDGAWCWFSDPRAVEYHGESSRTYAGWVTSRGDIVVGAYDHKTRKIQTFVLHEELEVDDHANPSLLFREDGRLLVFYSKHSDGSLRLRISREPEDIGGFHEEQKLFLNPVPQEQDSRAAYCYSNPVRLAEEGNRIDVFWRGSNWKPCVASSADGGKTWGRGMIAFSEKGSPAGVRPYLKVANDGRGRIHFAMTDGHPRNEKENSIYYCYAEKGALFRADGTRIQGGLPLAQSRMDQVYSGGGGGGRAWIWDIALDEKGLPVLVYTRLPEETEHIYYYARFDGKQWIDTRLTPAGGWFPQTRAGKREPEPHYSGGIVLDQVKPSSVFLSRPVDGVFEIEEWSTEDQGRTFASRPITRNSKRGNVRPVSVRGRRGAEGPRVLWMHLHGRYVHYLNYETSIRMEARQ